MGDPSSLRFIPASSAATPINWTRVPEDVKDYLLRYYVYDPATSKPKPLPATIGDLVQWFEGIKFFGYIDASELKLLMDISELGLEPSLEQPVGPRFYMEYTGEVWFLLFAPGTRDCIMGYCEDTVRWSTNDDDDDDDGVWERIAAQETMIAQAFDAKLEQADSRGKGEMVEFIKKLGRWTVWTLPDRYHLPRLREL